MKSPIPAILARYPTAGLSPESAPLYALERLSARLGHRVHVLREDLTRFALGGNKVRKLDYLLGDALARGAEVLLASGACSFTRNAAAAGRRCGLDVHVVLAEEECEHNAASRDVFALFGATLHHGADYTEVRARLAGDGSEVYELCPGGSDEIGALGYLQVFDQIAAYSNASGVHFDALFLPSGSTATQVGLVLGQALTGYDTRVIGIAISQPAEVQRRRVLDLALSTAERLGIELDPALVRVDDRFLGEGYATPSAEGRDAARAFAQLEGLLLDQVYTGKAAAGLIHYATNGLLSASGHALFVHTGGNFGLFY